MSRQFPKLRILAGILVLLSCFCAARAQERESENKLAASDQREIVAVLLADKFKASGAETIYISTANLTDELQKDFPRFKDKTVRLVSPEAAGKDSEICAYEFGKFEFIDKFVSVTFGNCRDGLAYDFIKDAAGWKSVSRVVIREIYY